MTPHTLAEILPGHGAGGLWASIASPANQGGHGALAETAVSTRPYLGDLREFDPVYKGPWPWR